MRGLLILRALLIAAGLCIGSSITDSQIDKSDRKQQKLIHKDTSLVGRPGRARPVRNVDRSGCSRGGILSLAQILFKLAMG